MTPATVTGGLLRASVIASLFFFTGVTATNYGSFECKVNNVVESSGTYTDSNYAPITSPFTTAECPTMVYFHNVECTFTFTAPTGWHVYLGFLTFDLDSSCGEDKVDLSFHPGARTICGHPIETPFDVSTSGSMTVVFTSNTNRRCTGFSGYFSAFDPSARKRRATQEIRNKDEALHYKETHGTQVAQAEQRTRNYLDLKDYCKICQDDGVKSCTCHPPEHSAQYAAKKKRSLLGLLAPGRPRVRRSGDCECVN